MARAGGSAGAQRQVQLDQLIDSRVIESARLHFLNERRADTVNSHGHKLVRGYALIAQRLDLFYELGAHTVNPHCDELID